MLGCISGFPYGSNWSLTFFWDTCCKSSTFVFLFLYLLPLLLAYYFLHWDYHQVAIILLGHWITLVDIFILASKCRVIQDRLMMMTSLYVISELRLILRFPLHFILLYFLWIQVSTFGWFEWFSYFAFRYTSYSFYQYCFFFIEL